MALVWLVTNDVQSKSETDQHSESWNVKFKIVIAVAVNAFCITNGSQQLNSM